MIEDQPTWISLARDSLGTDADSKAFSLAVYCMQLETARLNLPLKFSLVQTHENPDLAQAPDLQDSDAAEFYFRHQIPLALRAGSSNNPFYSPDDVSASIRPDNEDDEVVGEGSERFTSLGGIERAESAFSDDSASDVHAVSRSNQWQDVREARNTWLEDMTNKLMPPEETDLIVQRLVRKTDEHFRRTYIRGVAAGKVDESALVLNIGLSFLPGADTPQVNRLEQTDMTGKEPDQKDAMWRVTTAGSLLTYHHVAQDLSIIQTDKTSNLVSRAVSKRQEKDHYYLSKRKAKMEGDMPPDAVTIDSDQVKLVTDLQTGQWELEAMLIEVDGASLTNLITEFRHLIVMGGSKLSFEKTKSTLEAMIENARRLCMRSPILFRMSTRSRIISSVNTRYGVDHNEMFRTLTTSTGIREIISLSASYYNSLDSGERKDKTQYYIRPKFLQMLVLLLSLINDVDLSEIKDFLETTYGLRADRTSIEITILKVIPLISINAKVFLRSLIPAIEGYPLSQKNDESNSVEIWDVFMDQLLQKGYLVPGTVNDLGREFRSWIIKWPEDGFKSNGIFRHLQYSGRLRSANDIPAMELYPGRGLDRVAIIMTDHSKYEVSTEDLEPITCLNPGTYPVCDTSPNKNIVDLVIREVLINTDLLEAVRFLNGIIRKFNNSVANPKDQKSLARRMTLRKRSSVDQSFLSEWPGPKRLTKHVASLCGNNLAVTYKIQGRVVTRFEALRELTQSINVANRLAQTIEERWKAIEQRTIFHGVSSELKTTLETIYRHVQMTEKRRAGLAQEPDLSEEPIVQTIYPESQKSLQESPWYQYEAWSQVMRDGPSCLQVRAQSVKVDQVSWLNNEIIEVNVSPTDRKLFLSPLEPVGEAERDDEIQIDDVAFLLGNFLAIAVPDPSASRRDAPWIMTNYLRIQGEELTRTGRRGRNRMPSEQTHTMAICTFK